MPARLRVWLAPIRHGASHVEPRGAEHPSTRARPRIRARLHCCSRVFMVRHVSQSQVRSTEGPRPRAVVVAVQLPGVADDAFESSLARARAARADARSRRGRARHAAPRELATGVVLGEGKLKELADVDRRHRRRADGVRRRRGSRRRGGRRRSRGAMPTTSRSEGDGAADASQGAEGQGRARRSRPDADARCATSSARPAPRCSIARR